MKQFKTFIRRKTNNIFDEKLKQIEHFQRFPQLMPFIGANYDSKRILLVGESHFLESTRAQQTASDWYSLSYDKLEEDEVRNTNTSEIIIASDGRFAHRIYRNIHFAVCKAFGIDSDAWEYLAFMNFFQRPSERSGESIEHKQEDIDIANAVFQEVVRILEPKKIIFVSELAHSCYTNKEKVRYVPHPGSHWQWYCKQVKYGNKTGEELFMELIKQS